MSDALISGRRGDTSFLVDGTDAPRLATAPVAVPQPVAAPFEEPRLAFPAPHHAAAPGLPAPHHVGGPGLPANASAAVAPSLPDRAPAAVAPSLPVNAPVLPSHAAPAGPSAAAESSLLEDLPLPAANTHPMAALMPQLTERSQTSIRAAELRAAKKRKARRVKLGVLAGVLVVGAVAGPPLFGWVADAVNEAGDLGDE